MSPVLNVATFVSCFFIFGGKIMAKERNVQVLFNPFNNNNMIKTRLSQVGKRPALGPKGRLRRASEQERATCESRVI